jgi:hypothetical protein
MKIATYVTTTTALSAVFLCAGMAVALPTPEASLNTCQNAVKAATQKFVTGKVAAIGACLQAVSTQIVKKNAANASAAARTCVSKFRKLQDSRGLDKQLSDKLAAAITKKCDPGQPGVTHTLNDVLGSGAGVAQPLDADNLGAWCSHYGGNGTIATLQDWMHCITAAAECAVDSAIASQYPRVLDWLNLAKPAMQAVQPPAADSTKVSDAVAALTALQAEIDPNDTHLVSIQCGGIVSIGTALAANCLAGTTFSNSTAGDITGTMPDNGAVHITPTTTNQAIPAGYHNGSGYCAGDANLIAGNIKAGVSIFAVAGDSTVVDTGGATATASDIGSGKTAYVNGSLVTGTATIGSGSEPLATGQTTAYGPGSDGDLQKGAARSYADNGDGTITDNKTGLMWEKKSQDGSIHDYSNLYTWSGPSYASTNIMDGTITSTFLATLNAGSGFAGHTDWRIPNVNELHTLANYQNATPAVDPAFNTNCTGGCTVLTCDCTVPYGYWSSSAYQLDAHSAWFVSFVGGNVDETGKSGYFYARAVRGG